MTDPAARPQRPASRPKPAKATKYVAAGAAVGATFALAGGMAAAASATTESPAPPTTVRHVVVDAPPVTSSTPIVIVLPSNDSTVQVADILPDVIAAIDVPATPEPVRAATTPAAAPAQPVTESAGS